MDRDSMDTDWTLKFNFDTYLFLMINNKYK